MSFRVPGVKIGGPLNITTGGGAVTFNGPVNGDVAGRALTVNSGAGLIEFVTNLGNLQPLGNLNLSTTSGNIELNAVSGNTVLGGTTTFNSGSGSILIGTAGTNAASINSNQIQQSLTIQTSGAGAITFAGPVGTTSPFRAFPLDWNRGDCL